MNNTRKLVQLALLSFVFIFNANSRGIRLEFGQRFPLPVRTEYSLLSQWSSSRNATNGVGRKLFSVPPLLFYVNI